MEPSSPSSSSSSPSPPSSLLFTQGYSSTGVTISSNSKEHGLFHLHFSVEEHFLYRYIFLTLDIDDDGRITHAHAKRLLPAFLRPYVSEETFQQVWSHLASSAAPLGDFVYEQFIIFCRALSFVQSAILANSFSTDSVNSIFSSIFNTSTFDKSSRAKLLGFDIHIRNAPPYGFHENPRVLF